MPRNQQVRRGVTSWAGIIHPGRSEEIVLLYAVEAGRKEHACDRLRLLSDTSCPIVTANGLGRQHSRRRE